MFILQPVCAPEAADEHPSTLPDPYALHAVHDAPFKKYPSSQLKGFNAKHVKSFAEHFTHVFSNSLYPAIQESAVNLSVHVFAPTPQGLQSLGVTLVSI